MSKNRLYSDQEVSEILKRAGEMQATQSPAETHGLSLSELQQIAAEVGLDPKIIAAAAAEMEHSGIVENASGFLGAATSLYVERVIPGEIDQALMPEVAAKIGEAFGMVGRSGQVGNALEWTHSSERSNLQVTVMPHNGQTKVRVIGKFPRIALAFFLPALIVGGVWTSMIPLAMELPAAAVLAIASVGLMVGYFLARFGFSAYVRKKERAAEKLMRELDDMIDEANVPVNASVHEPVNESSPAIELPDETPEPGGKQSAKRLKE